MKPEEIENFENEINLEWQFKQYLIRVKAEHLSPNSIQYIEMKRAFFGGIGNFIVMQRDVLAELDDDVCEIYLKNIWDQISKFWNDETAKQILGRNHGN